MKINRKTLAPWIPYAIAIGGTIAMAMLRFILRDMADDKAPLVLFTIPIALAAFYGGLRPGVIATALSLTLGVYLFIQPVYTFYIADAGAAISLLGSLMAWLLIVVLAEFMHEAIEARDTAATKLSASRRDYDDVLDKITDGFYTLDRDWVVRFANRALMELVGGTPESILNKHFLEAFDYDGNHKLLADIKAAAKSDKLELVTTSDTTDTRHFELRVYPIGSPREGTGIFVQDVSEKRTLEKLKEQQLADERAKRSDAEQESRMKDEFVATLSHELRTPLTAIVGWTDILRSRVGEAPQFQEGIETIDRAARLQAQLIDDLLDMSRIVTGQLSFTWEILDMDELCRDVIKDLRVRAEDHDLKLEYAGQPDIFVRGDHLRLSQVIANLVANSIKFTDPGGTIRVTLNVVNNRARIQVSDNGIGLEPDVLPKIFEKFRQANSTITREKGGLGLGLAIVKQLAEAHGGQVSAASPGLKRGSTFTVDLPIAMVSPQLGQESAPADLPAMAKAWRVMLVEDDDLTRRMLQAMLTDAGLEVFDFDRASLAEEALTTLRPDLVISDIGMPGRDGYDLIRSLREFHEAQIARTKAIALTAFALEEDRKRALEAGFNFHVPKPVRRENLLRAIQDVMSTESLS